MKTVIFTVEIIAKIEDGIDLDAVTFQMDLNTTIPIGADGQPVGKAEEWRTANNEVLTYTE
jgi:hypothetical protein